MNRESFPDLPKGMGETALRLDGRAVAREIRSGLHHRVEVFTASASRSPCLGILLAGDDPGSQIYVRNKIKNGQELGIETDLRRLPVTASLDDALAVVDEFNRSDGHDGILVQSPLPKGMGEGVERRVFDLIDPAKDVDGFSAVNVGRLVQNRPTLAPCTPSGVIELLDRSGIQIEGARVVVIGRSDIVGKPMAMLLLHRNATVTVCHSRTLNLPSVAAAADILIAAIGRPGFVTTDFVKPGATVIDVGMNQLNDRGQVESIYGIGSKKLEAFDRRGSVVMGDVHPAVEAIAGALTPVPGGVGPLTIAMLLSNTISAAERRRERLEA